MDTAAARETTRRILAEIFGPPATRIFAVRFWDGSVEAAGTAGDPVFTLVLRRPSALRRMLLPPTERALGEAFVRGDFDVIGDLEAATALSPVIRRHFGRPRRAVRLIAHLRSIPRERREAGSRSAVFRPRYGRARHSERRDAEAVRFHYDVGNDFYRLFLDRRMVYSCAYFRDPSDDLDTAQEAKLEHICRKLDLRPGDRLLDVGCGWGGLIEFAARNFGVAALGITLSERQAEFARRRIAASGLTWSCMVRVLDYRALPSHVRFDKIVSVGMVEHVGRANLRRYHDHLFRHLEPGGLFLNHGIVSQQPRGRLHRLTRRPLRRWTSFLDSHVFPDSELVPASQLIGPAEASGFEVRDLENLREHYILTLRHWLRRLDASRDEAIACAGQRLWRVWRLYLAGSANAFATGRVGVVQLLLARRRTDGSVTVPHTREHLYADQWAPGTGARRRADGAVAVEARVGGNGKGAR